MNELFTVLVLILILACSLLLLISPVTVIRIQTRLPKLFFPRQFRDEDLLPGGIEALRLLNEDPQEYTRQYSRIVRFFRFSGLAFLAVFLVALWILY
jgi:hypothetical protein